MSATAAGRLHTSRPLAVALSRDGRLPPGADEAACEVGESGGTALVVGTGAGEAGRALADLLGGSVPVATAETGPGLQAGTLAASLAPLCATSPLVVLPASADGRDLAPRLAALLDRPLLSRAVRIAVEVPEARAADPDGAGRSGRSGRSGRPGDPGELGTTVRIRAELTRLDDRILVPVTVEGPAVATFVPGSRAVTPISGAHTIPGAADRVASAEGGATTSATVVDLPDVAAVPDVAGIPDVEIEALLPPDPATMDLADAGRVLGGGAGLVPPGTDDATAVRIFELLAEVATALGASAGATRVATDAGWIDHDRQIGTTGVAVDPELYVAFGISGASQHVGGLGHPQHVVSVNTDPSCPMTSMARLGVVADALGTLVALAGQVGVAVPPAIDRITTPGGNGGDHGDGGDRA